MHRNGRGEVGAADAKRCGNSLPPARLLLPAQEMLQKRLWDSLGLNMVRQFSQGFIPRCCIRHPPPCGVSPVSLRPVAHS